MSFAVSASSRFKRELKRLARKYPSLLDDVEALVKRLADEPILGTPLGKGLYKIRLAITSKGTGRSGGGRVITYVKVVRRQVVLAAIYDKSEQDSISNAELKAMARDADSEFS